MWARALHSRRAAACKGMYRKRPRLPDAAVKCCNFECARDFSCVLVQEHCIPGEQRPVKVCTERDRGCPMVRCNPPLTLHHPAAGRNFECAQVFSCVLGQEQCIPGEQWPVKNCLP